MVLPDLHGDLVGGHVGTRRTDGLPDQRPLARPAHPRRQPGPVHAGGSACSIRSAHFSSIRRTRYTNTATIHVATNVATMMNPMLLKSRPAAWSQNSPWRPSFAIMICNNSTTPTNSATNTDNPEMVML